MFSFRDELRPVGAAQPAAGAVEPLQQRRRAAARACACSRSPTGPSSTSGATSSEEELEVPSIYFAHEREVFERDGMLLAVSEHVELRDGEAVRDAARALPHGRRHDDHRRRALRRRRRRRRDRRDRGHAASPSAARPAPTTARRRPRWKTASARATSRWPPADRAAAARHRRLGRRRQVDADRAAAATTPRRCIEPTSVADAEADLAHVTDGLRAEREQGITIDVAYRFFATPSALVHHRRHARATSATRATWSPAPRPRRLALVLIDARNGHRRAVAPARLPRPRCSGSATSSRA